MAYKNQKKNKAHVKDLQRDWKGWRRARRLRNKKTVFQRELVDLTAFLEGKQRESNAL